MCNLKKNIIDKKRLELVQVSNAFWFGKNAGKITWTVSNGRGFITLLMKSVDAIIIFSKKYD